MTDQELELKLTQLVNQERKITNEILHLINLAESRKLYAARGYASLFDWLVQGFGYSNAAAYRRIQAAHAIQIAPEITEKLENGTLTLTSVAKAQSMIKAYERKSGDKLSQEECKEVFLKLENQTSKEAAKTLATFFPENAKPEIQRQISDTETEFSLTLSTEAMNDLEWLKAHWSHIFPDGKAAEILTRALRNERERCEKTNPEERPSQTRDPTRRRQVPISRPAHRQILRL